MNRVRRKIHNEGYYELLKSISRNIYISEFVYKVKLEPFDVAFSDSLIFSEMTLSDLCEAKATYHKEINPYKYAIIYDRIVKNSSDKVYLVRYEGNIAGYFHIAFEDNYDTCTNVYIENISDNIHLFDDYTFKDYRGKGVHNFSIYSRLKLGLDKGFKTATVHILKDNIFSIKAYRKNGFIVVKKISVYLRTIKSFSKITYHK